MTMQGITSNKKLESETGNEATTPVSHCVSIINKISISTSVVVIEFSGTVIVFVVVFTSSSGVNL